MQYSIVKYKKVRENSNIRIDAEFFKHDFNKTEQLIKSKKYSELRDIISLLTDYHANGSYETLRNNVKLLMEPNYAHMIRTIDIERDDFISDVIFVDEQAYNFLDKSKIYGGEIIINKIGNAGNAYLIPPITQKTTLGMNQFMIRVNNNVNNYYLYCYLTCIYGVNQLKQRITGAVPLSIDKESTRSVLVPLFSTAFQNIISNIVSYHFVLKNNSKQKYAAAEALLLSELGLEGWEAKHKLSFVRDYSEVEAAGRCDAEYFQPKYDEIIHKIKNYKNGFDSVKNIINKYSTGYPFNSKSYVKYSDLRIIRINNIKNGELIYENMAFLNNQDYKLSPRDLIEINDILISMSGTIGETCKIRKYNNAIINQRILKFSLLKSKKIDEDILVLILNSILGKQQFKRIGTGAVQTNISSNDIFKILIPIFDDKIQLEIKENVTESFEMRDKSKKLLEIAKLGVEKAIEEDEDAATNWIDEELKKLDVVLNDIDIE